MSRFSSLLSSTIFISVLIKTEVEALGDSPSTEPSAEYLYNVIKQLQEHNRPPRLSADRTTGPGADLSYYNVGLRKNLGDLQQQNDRLQTDNPAIYSHDRYIDSKHLQSLTDHSIGFDSDQLFTEHVTPRYQLPAPKISPQPIRAIKEPAPLGLTRAELAFLYKNGLQRGLPVSLNLLKNSLVSGDAPQTNGNQVRQIVKSAHPEYYYYFYPLKTFADELKSNNHGYETAILNNNENVQMQHSDLAVASSDKEMANPLFMAISGFIGMALIFMASVLFLPRFDNFGTRNSSGEFLQLTKVAWEAIEGRDCSKRFACELNKVAVKFKISKRSRRLLENIIPISIGGQMTRMRKSKKKRQECGAIACKCA